MDHLRPIVSTYVSHISSPNQFKEASNVIPSTFTEGTGTSSQGELITHSLTVLTILIALASARPSRSSDRSKLTAAVAAEHLDEFGAEANAANAKKRSRPRKKKPKTASDDETDYVTDSDASSNSADSDIEMVVANEEVRITCRSCPKYWSLSIHQLANALPSKTVPEKTKRITKKAKSKRAKTVSCFCFNS